MYEELSEYINRLVTYKEMCEITHMKYYTGGKAKKLQIEDIERFYRLEKVKTKYKVIEKYAEPLEKEDNRKSEYYDDLETVVLYLLQQTSSNKAIWSMSKVLQLTNMVNENYRIGKKDIMATSKVLEVNDTYVYNFYNISQNRFKRIFESVLGGMERKALIIKNDCIMMCKSVSNIMYNEVGEPVINNKGNIVYTIEKVYVEATESECVVIGEIRGEVLDLLQCKDTSEVFLRRKWDMFTKEMNKRLRERLNADFCYKAYKIIKNTDRINNTITKIESDISSANVNKLTTKCMMNSNDKKIDGDIDDRELLVGYLISSSNNIDLKMLIDRFVKQENEDADSVLPF